MVDWKTIDYDTMSLDEAIELVRMYVSADQKALQVANHEVAIKEAKKYNSKDILVYYFKHFDHKDPKSCPLSNSNWMACWWLTTRE